MSLIPNIPSAKCLQWEVLNKKCLQYQMLKCQIQNAECKKGKGYGYLLKIRSPEVLLSSPNHIASIESTRPRFCTLRLRLRPQYQH